ncbi:hypothetical protein BZG36_01707 [Bifiguratus adelaidae]|uniref:Amine oxidase domain-containing protein n=1 Tax=Bifiguratus adelaidae TaxID=1938954 RepID=A0A261Y4R0_9FUNG|nr:hypothetical protein BZG36_01707 [Bifiguratus adelaidae]
MPRVAIVGSGLGGLVTAHALTNDHNDYEVHVYEKHRASYGMDASSFWVDLEAIDGSDTDSDQGRQPSRRVRVDVPVRGFFRDYYPSLVKLYEHLDITLVPASHTISLSILSDNDPQKQPSLDTYFSHSSIQLPWLNMPFPYPRHRIGKWTTSAAICVGEWVRLGVHARWWLRQQTRNNSDTSNDSSNKTTTMASKRTETLQMFLDRHHYHPLFINTFLAPVLASICTCSLEATLQMPSSIALDFLARGIMTQQAWKVGGEKGVGLVCDKLGQHVSRWRRGVGVVSVWKHKQTDQWMVRDSEGKEEAFDIVVFATQANQAYHILRNQPSNAQPIPDGLLDTLRSFTYAPTSVLTHRQPNGFMPTDKRDWGSINVVIRENDHLVSAKKAQDSFGEPGQPMATCWMNEMMSVLAKGADLFQTVNPIIPPPSPPTTPSKSKPSRFTVPSTSPVSFARITLTPDTPRLLNQLDRYQGGTRHSQGLYFVGSYVYPGVPLLEGCVVSGVRAAGMVLQDKQKATSRKVVEWLEPDVTGWKQGHIMEWYLQGRGRQATSSRFSLFSLLFDILDYLLSLLPDEIVILAIRLWQTLFLVLYWLWAIFHVACSIIYRRP